VILARAPLRISLGGGGTDLPSYYEHHGGFVLGAAIDKYVYLIVNRPAADTLVRVKYSRSEEVQSATEVEHDLVRPALALMGIDRNIEIASMADVPAGTGLGSSSTYIAALLLALHALGRRSIPPHSVAELANHVETDMAGHPVGKQDHYMAAFGGITCLDIGMDGTTKATPLGISLSTIEELEGRLLLFFTGLNRSASPILLEQQQDTLAGDADVLTSLHLTKELGLRIRDALEEERLDDFGTMMHEHWEHKKRRSAQISSSWIDRCYTLARDAGATGGKLVGAGGGGFLMLYCRPEVKSAVRTAMAAQRLREMPFRFDFEGAKIMVNL
jgi:D-glycero-alpha-D-manno-heptose-7-phosphate kinase